MTTGMHHGPGEMTTRPAQMPQPRQDDGRGPSTAPIIVAVDGTRASSIAAADAVLLGRDTRAPVVFVYVRRGPSTVWGKPFCQRRLTRALANARIALEAPYMLARDAGVGAEVEILEGSPAAG